MEEQRKIKYHRFNMRMNTTIVIFALNVWSVWKYKCLYQLFKDATWFDIKYLM